MHKFIAIVGMAGAGKSVVADELILQGYQFFRFGQITMDIIIEKGLEPTEQNEKMIRENVRKEYGMGAYAILNLHKIDNLLKNGNVAGDGLYSWDEFKILKEKYREQLCVLAVYAPPNIRYERLSQRKTPAKDKNLRNRPMALEQAKSRDFAEIENIAKAGPIAMADFTLVNTGSLSDLYQQLNRVLSEIK
jgi:dephospho-CoA kinase